MVPRIVITGAPGSGKTKLIERLKAEPLLDGFVYLPEAARQLLTERPELRGKWSQFHREIYALQTSRETAASGKPLITDRGTVDAYAFHPETLSEVGTSPEQEYRRYSLVIQLGTAASIATREWKTDDIRRESREEAMEIEKAITGAWQGHPNYRFVPAAMQIDDKYTALWRLIRESLTADQTVKQATNQAVNQAAKQVTKMVTKQSVDESEAETS